MNPWSPIQVWFVCKECREQFPQLAEFLEHKTNKHLDEFQKITCIVFEEIHNPIKYFVPVPSELKQESHLNLQGDARPNCNGDQRTNPGINDTTSVSVNGLPCNPATQSITIDDADEDSHSYLFDLGNTANASDTDIDNLYLEENGMNNLLSIETEEFENDQDPLDCSMEFEVKPELFIYENESKCEEITEINPAVIFLPPNPYVRLTRLTAQEIRNSTQIQHECKLCAKKLNLELELKIHVGICSLYHKNRNRFCIPCNCIFANSSNLSRHNLRVHSRKGLQINSQGDRKYLKNTSLKRKKKRRTSQKSKWQGRPYECKVCGSAFSRSDNLLVHRTVHTGERPYSCPVSNCEKTFRTKDNLRSHLVHHSDNRPFPCPYLNCAKSFKFNSNLTEHKVTCKFK